MTLLRTENLSVSRGGNAVLTGVSLGVEPGEVVGLIGPNGAGKTTLLRAALGLLPFTGESSLAAMDARARARSAAFLPQDREIAWPMPVERVVALGRLPHLAAGDTPHGADLAAIDTALDTMDLTWARSRPATSLSGGEQARVLLARALAQDAPLLLADEPVNGLDPSHQIATMETFRTMAQTGRSVVASLHDLSLALSYCDRLVILQNGAVVADGPPVEVATPPRLRAVFGIVADISQTSQGLWLRVLGRAT